MLISRADGIKKRPRSRRAQEVIGAEAEPTALSFVPRKCVSLLMVGHRHHRCFDVVFKRLCGACRRAACSTLFCAKLLARDRVAKIRLAPEPAFHPFRQAAPRLAPISVCSLQQPAIFKLHLTKAVARARKGHDRTEESRS
jgi:hypothetical protein